MVLGNGLTFLGPRFTKYKFSETKAKIISPPLSLPSLHCIPHYPNVLNSFLLKCIACEGSSLFVDRQRTCITNKNLLCQRMPPTKYKLQSHCHLFWWWKLWWWWWWGGGWACELCKRKQQRGAKDDSPTSSEQEAVKPFDKKPFQLCATLFGNNVQFQLIGVFVLCCFSWSSSASHPPFLIPMMPSTWP